MKYTRVLRIEHWAIMSLKYVGWYGPCASIELLVNEQCAVMNIKMYTTEYKCNVWMFINEMIYTFQK